MKYAFRCRTCHNLETGGHAGENAVPRGCRACGAGTHFELNGAGVPIAVDDPDNWIVLADLSEDALAPILEFHGIDAKAIGKHKPTPSTPTREPQAIERHATEELGAEDLAG